jgi:hypothetical protein
MLFNSLSFLFVFLPIVYLVFWRLRLRQARYVWLTITGYAFYSFWDYRFCALMAFSTLVWSSCTRAAPAPSSTSNSDQYFMGIVREGRFR